MSNLHDSDDRNSIIRYRRTRLQPKVQIVSQVSLEFPRVRDAVDNFGVVQNEVLRWISNRAGTKLPDAAWEGHSFVLNEIGSQPLEAIKLTDHFWAARLDDADKQVPQRTWTTEFVIRVEPDIATKVSFGCRLSCTALGENPMFTPTIPGVLRQINDQLGGSLDGQPLSQSAWRVEDDKSVTALVNLLLEPTRHRAVIVVSSPPYGEPALISTRSLAKSLIGVAHVVDLSSEASFALTDRIGREFSVFNGAVRTYHPDFLPEEDQPTDHPRAIFERIRHWQDDYQTFEQFLISRTIQEDLSRRHIRKELPSFTSIQAQNRQRERERLRAEGATDSELLQVAEEQIRDLEKKIDETEQLLEIAEYERDHVNQELAQTREQSRIDIFGLNTRIDSLLDVLHSSGGTEDISYPDNLDELEGWANRYLAGSVQVLNRAYRAAKKAQFEETEFVYLVLQVLRDHYVPLRFTTSAEAPNRLCTAVAKGFPV